MIKIVVLSVVLFEYCSYIKNYPDICEQLTHYSLHTCSIPMP